MSDELEATVRDGIATLIVNRPHVKNAIPTDMWRPMAVQLDEWSDTPEVRALVLTGAGDDFGSGADVGQFSGGPKRHPLEVMRQVGAAVEALYRFPKPVVARVRGVCAGVSLNLALACDLVIADETVRMSQIFSRRALSIDGGGSWILPRIVGMQKAKELVLLAEMVDAHEALRLGLVTRVVAPDRLDAEVDGIARRLADGPTFALGHSKRLLKASATSTIAEAVEAEAQAQALNFSSADSREAAKAFAEKRPATFTGR